MLVGGGALAEFCLEDEGPGRNVLLALFQARVHRDETHDGFPDGDHPLGEGVLLASYRHEHDGVPLENLDRFVRNRQNCASVRGADQHLDLDANEHPRLQDTLSIVHFDADLRGLAARYDVERMVVYLRAPQPPMPLFELSDEERRDLAAYVLDRFR